MRLHETAGLVTNDLGWVLRELASCVPPGYAIVELGSYKGKSTAFLADGAPEGVPVYAVDLWDDPRNVVGRHGYNSPTVREEFDRQLTELGLRERVVTIRGDSADTAEVYAGPPVGLLYVDGDHTERGVRRDVEAWWDRLGTQPIVAFDDYGTRRNPGVKIVVDSLGLPVEVRAGQLAVVRP